MRRLARELREITEAHWRAGELLLASAAHAHALVVEAIGHGAETQAREPDQRESRR